MILAKTKCSLQKKLGAWMNETRIRVSARHSIADSLYTAGIPFSGRIEDLPETINDLKKLMPKCSGVRRYGAAAPRLGICCCWPMKVIGSVI